MICRNCGQKINVYAKECGWCKTPVGESAGVSFIAGLMAVVGVILGGALGFVVEDIKGIEGDSSGMLAGLTAAVGGCIGYVFGRINGNRLADTAGKVNQSGCPNCGFDPGYDITKHPDRYCSRCGKRFGG